MPIVPGFARGCVFGVKNGVFGAKKGYFWVKNGVKTSSSVDG